MRFPEVCFYRPFQVVGHVPEGAPDDFHHGKLFDYDEYQQGGGAALGGKLQSIPGVQLVREFSPAVQHQMGDPYIGVVHSSVETRREVDAILKEAGLKSEGEMMLVSRGDIPFYSEPSRKVIFTRR